MNGEQPTNDRRGSKNFVYPFVYPLAVVMKNGLCKILAKSLFLLARLAGLEPATYCLEGHGMSVQPIEIEMFF